MRRLPCVVAFLSALVATIASAEGSVPSPAFGTTNTTYVRFEPSDFNPIFSNQVFTDRWMTLAGNDVFVTNPRLPTGAIVTSMQFRYCDNDDTPFNDVALAFLDCPADEDCQGLTLIESITSQSDGCQTITKAVADYVVDNVNRRLFLEVGFPPSASATFATTAVLGYRLQVSPAPVTPTFNDVPTSHPFYQFIEALAASGITGGCGSGAYCPNSPVTRGQMAVFLAKALGLNWPN
jgi:hypothetical protein